MILTLDRGPAARVTHPDPSWEDADRDELASWATATYLDGKSGEEREMSLLTPTGALWGGLVGLADRDLWVEVRDRRPRPFLWSERPEWLRVSQGASIESLVRAEPFGRGIIQAGCGFGKSRVACALPVAFPGRWVFLVHRVGVAEAVARQYEELIGEPAGWVGPGRLYVPDDCSMVVCSFASLYRRLERGDPEALALADSIAGVCVDECHVLPADTYYQVARSFRGAYWWVGMSATPLARSDRRSILAVAMTGPVVYRSDAAQTAAIGATVRGVVKLIPVHHPPADTSDWATLYQRYVVESDLRNDAIVDAIVEHEPPGVCFVRRPQHARLLCDRLNAKGIPTEWVSGKTPGPVRARLVQDLKSGETLWVIATKVWTEGVDIPELRTVVLAGGGRSEIDAVQEAGRVIRLSNGKQEGTILLVYDRGIRTLQRHARERYDALAKAGLSCEPLPQPKRNPRPKEEEEDGGLVCPCTDPRNRENEKDRFL